jgi:hypothetical protein
MAADPIIYCLEHVTDYDQFERLCHDLMVSEGYSNIEPLGGVKDKGRDAIHISRSDPDDVIIFAYSVREDWRKKLAEDADKIRTHGHKCSRFAFICTAPYSSSERDQAVSYIRDEFGWTLELYGLERLRMLLATKYEHILAKHPQIFTPPFFPTAGGVTLAFSPDYLVIDYVDRDEALATWLARRLTIQGYLVWCRSIAPVAGSSLNETIEALLEYRAFRFIPVLSPAAVVDPDIAARRATALAIATKRGYDLVIPIIATPFDKEALDNKTRQLEMPRFDQGWQTGLDELLESIEAANCPHVEGGASIALRSFIPSHVLSTEPERLLSNRFPVLDVPEVIHRFISKYTLESDKMSQFNLEWSFRQVDPTTFLSFHHPPELIRDDLVIQPAGGCTWADVSDIDGISTRDLVSELIRKALLVACATKGLAFCEELSLPYFPSGLVNNDRLHFRKPDGSKTWLNTVGKRTYWRPGSSSEYRYHLAPIFLLRRIPGGELIVVTRIRLRLTDAYGELLDNRTAVSRRKHLCKDWWNDDWLHRILAIMQFLGDGEDITIEDSMGSTIAISAKPNEWIVPISIDETALPWKGASRDEALTYGSETEDDEVNLDGPGDDD